MWTLYYYVNFESLIMVKDLGLQYVNELAFLVNEMAPYLLLGFLFAGILKVFFPQHQIKRFMGGRDTRSVVNAALLGVPMPLCSCGVIPTGISFYKNGASRGSAVSFLISTPQTGVDSILATYSLLGLPLAIIRPLVALLTGIFGGVLGNMADKGRHKEAISEEVNPAAEGERSLREVFRYGFVELLQDITKWLIIGLLLAAFLSVLIPDDFFTTMVGNEYLSMLILLLASVPLYICATGSIPIAAVLLMKGLSPGAAVVLLMAGPATNIATMAVIGNTMGRKTLWLYLTSIIGGALFFGFLINELVPREWITGHIPLHIHELDHHETLAWLKWASSALLLAFIVNGQIQKILQRKNIKIADSEKQQNMGTIKEYRVEGMTCNHCKANVEKGVSSLENISDAYADPDRNLLRVKTGVDDDEAIRKAVEELGYVFKGRLKDGE